MPQSSWNCATCNKQWDLAFIKEDLEPEEIIEFEFEEIRPQTWTMVWCPECSPGLPRAGFYTRAQRSRKSTVSYLWNGKRPQKMLE